METILIQTASKSKMKLFLDLAKQLGENVKVLDKEIAEELALGKLMQQSKTGKYVSKESIMAQLNK